MKLMRIRITLVHVVGFVVFCAVAFAVLTLATARSNDSDSANRNTAVSYPTKVVPGVEGQAYVFAESTLLANGFGWKVTGKVAGWAQAIVKSQYPAAGTTVIDTGDPLVTLRLSMPKGYKPRGTPQNESPYTATKIMLPGNAAATEILTTGSQPTIGRSSATTSTSASTTAPKPEPEVSTSPAQKRPLAFVIAGAKPEPLDEIPLPQRAKKLNRWLDSHRRLSSANEGHWLYQHAWIVTGAKFGWWHGAQALRTLIKVDQRIERLWGVGSKSEAEARAALEFVHAHGG
jgi:hypothetical protein